MNMVRWPDGRRSAAIIAFDLDGPTGAAMIDGSIWSAPRRFAEGGYGPFRALPRLLDLLHGHGVSATFFIPAWVVEHWPDAAASIVAAGHEAAHHGYLHERFADLTDGQQHEVIDRSQEVFNRILGAPAVGYRTPTGDWSAETPQILLDSGFRYSSSLRDGHAPYRHHIGGDATSLIEIPARVDLDDYAYFAYSRDPDFPSGGDRIAPYRAVLDNLIREADGHRDVGGCLITTFHPKVSGTPGRARIVNALVENLAADDEVWLTTARDVAEHAHRELDTDE